MALDVPNRGIHELTRGKVKHLFFPRVNFLRGINVIVQLFSESVGSLLDKFHLLFR